MIRLLRHPDIGVRGYAATALGELYAAEAQPELVKLLGREKSRHVFPKIVFAFDKLANSLNENQLKQTIAAFERNGEKIGQAGPGLRGKVKKLVARMKRQLSAIVSFRTAAGKGR